MTALVRAWGAWLRWWDNHRSPALIAVDTHARALGLDDVTNAETTPLRLVHILNQAARWRAELTAARADGSACSCSGGRLVVIHEPDTPCGDRQDSRLWHAVDGSGAIDTTDAVNAVLDELRGDHRATR